METSTTPTSTAPKKTYKKNGKIVYQEDCYGNTIVNENPQSKWIEFDECETPIYRISK